MTDKIETVIFREFLPKGEVFLDHRKRCTLYLESRGDGTFNFLKAVVREDVPQRRAKVEAPGAPKGTGDE